MPTTSEPIEKTDHLLRVQLAETLTQILSNGVTVEALRGFLDRRRPFTPADVVDNVHLFERLTDGAELLKAMHGYETEHRGYVKVPAGA